MRLSDISLDSWGLQCFSNFLSGYPRFWFFWHPTIMTNVLQEKRFLNAVDALLLLLLLLLFFQKAHNFFEFISSFFLTSSDREIISMIYHPSMFVFVYVLKCFLNRFAIWRFQSFNFRYIEKIIIWAPSGHWDISYRHYRNYKGLQRMRECANSCCRRIST